MPFQNAQWAVTPYGLEAQKPEAPYEIEKCRLTETMTRGGEEYYLWPVHMAEKTPWLKYDQFVAAFREALEYHEGHYSPAVDADLLEKSIAVGTEIYAEALADELTSRARFGDNGVRNLADLADEIRGR
jgi:hypothetical protein